MEAARLWARGELTTEGADDTNTAEKEQAQLGDAMAFFGLVPDRPIGPAASAGEVFYLWPENLPAWSLFMDCGTQWRSDASGSRTGLDYQGVHIVMVEWHGLAPRKRRERWGAIRLLERACLQAWSEKRQEQEPAQ